MVPTEGEEQSVVLGKRHAEPYPSPERAGPVIADSQRGGVHVAPVDVKATAHSVDRVVGVGKRKRGDLVDGSGGDLHAHGVAGAEKIALLNRGLNDELVDIGKSHTEQHRAGGFLLDPHGDVDLIGRATHRRSLDLDFAEIARLVDSLLGELQLLAVEKAALELAHLATHHLVAGARVADDVDPPDIDAPSGVDQKREADLALFLVDIGIRNDVGKGIALPPQPVGNGLGRLGELFPGKRFARFDRDQRAKLRLGDEQVSPELHLGHFIFLALGDVDRDVDIVTIGGNRDLSGVDSELEVAPVQVVRTQRFEVGLKFLPRVLVVLRKPGEPAGGAQLDYADQFVLGKGPIAHDVDSLDLRIFAVVYVEIDCDSVAFVRRDGRGDLHAVKTTGQILTFELLLGLVEQGAVENAAFLESDVAQPLLDLVLFEFLHPDEIDRSDGRTLFESHDQHVSLDLESDVPKEPRRKQGTNRPRGFFVGQRVADFHGEIAEDGSRLDALDALDANIAHHEGLERPCRPGEHEQEERGSQRVFHR